MGYEGNVSNNQLTFTGPARFQYELGADGRVKVNPDGTITVSWWLRDHEGNWHPWMKNTFTKIRDEK